MKVVELTCRLCGNPFPLPSPSEWDHPVDIAAGPCCSAWVSRGLRSVAALERTAEGA